MNYIIDKIVIVDNASNNNSYCILKDRYENRKNVQVIKTGNNLGFAKGNNIGINYIKKHVKSDFVMIVNNDTIFCDKDMLDILIAGYKRGIGVIGPKIIGKDKKNQNPILKRLCKKNIEKEIEYKGNVKGLKRREVSNESLYLFYIKYMIKRCLYHDTILHGACMVLTPDYFKYFDCLYPKTFLYYEEDILKLLLNKIGLKMKYISKTKIYHKEDQSSGLAFQNDSKIINKYILESAKLCLELYDKSYKDIINQDFSL